ncbi:N-ethylmaleimide reductase [Nitrospirillum amazonense]|uniref:N-ethylmaleimide reductase n=1 Tax=Nitrospirillum amazonense TaxID=28077 RepID=A0A560J6J4_9PROT|nr:alkene reductase [Nitrospirillum amazonense]TWB66079.1 N-ethylmaleimide reductase [Nitrospirillum amazonense]
MASIFSPIRLGDLTLNNRVVMAPMTRCRAGVNDEPTADMAEYYRQRAGAGLIVSEGVQPSIHGKGYFRTPGIHTPLQMAAWHAVTAGVRAAGGSIVMQLMHCGRVGAAGNKDPWAETLAPSAIRSRQALYTAAGMAPCAEPRALATAEIAGVVDEMAAAARNARAAGFDGVELHATSGYLPMQFLATGTNQRTDRYGGSPQNRARFVIEVLEAMAAAIGSGRVGFRISPGNGYNDMEDEEPVATYTALLRAVEPLGLAYLHLINTPIPELEPLSFVRQHWTGPVIGNGGLTLDSAQKLLSDGRLEAVSFGRFFISNPDLVARFRNGAPLVEPDRGTFYSGDARGFTDYPQWSADVPVAVGA